MNFKTLPYLTFGGNFTSESLSIIFFKLFLKVCRYLTERMSKSLLEKKKWSE